MKTEPKEKPICHVCGCEIDDKDFTYDGENIVVHRQCLDDETDAEINELEDNSEQVNRAHEISEGMER